MSVSQVSICNSALVMVGAERISSIDQDCKRAIILKAIYNQTRDAVFRARKWNFAKKRAILAPTATTPDWGFNFQYDLPNDYMGFLETDPDDIVFTIESKKILTNENSLSVSYIFRQEDESEWDPSFAKAMSCLLASEIAYNMTQSVTLVDRLLVAYKAAISDASFNNSAEKTLTGIESTSWTDARKR